MNTRVQHHKKPDSNCPRPWRSINAGHFFVVGMIGVAVFNWCRWRRDRMLAARLRGRERKPVVLSPTPKVSVLVAAWNEADMIRAHVEAFLRLSYPHEELILCAGGQDGTFDLARRYAGEHVVVLEQHVAEGKQRALHRCLEAATGSIVFLTDADCLLDDDSFVRTLAPLILEGEDVATGTSRPLERQLGNPFVVYQWGIRSFSNAQRPSYVSGVLGRNCAVSEGTLAGIGGFGADVPTGTDYHMAKLLLRDGHRIRFVPDSAIETKYPDTVHSYWRRQSRWVRNLVVHGPTFGAYDEVAMALRTGLSGLTMLMLPVVAAVAGPVVLAAWGILFGHAFLAKLRYARFARLCHGIESSLKQMALIPIYMLIDFVAWSRSLIDLVARRDEW